MRSLLYNFSDTSSASAVETPCFILDANPWQVDTKIFNISLSYLKNELNPQLVEVFFFFYSNSEHIHIYLNSNSIFKIELFSEVGNKHHFRYSWVSLDTAKLPNTQLEMILNRQKKEKKKNIERKKGRKKAREKERKKKRRKERKKEGKKEREEKKK